MDSLARPQHVNDLDDLIVLEVLFGAITISRGCVRAVPCGYGASHPLYQSNTNSYAVVFSL